MEYFIDQQIKMDGLDLLNSRIRQSKHKSYKFLKGLHTLFDDFISYDHFYDFLHFFFSKRLYFDAAIVD